MAGNPNWTKGTSGNPSGRPRIVEEFRNKARKAVDEHVIAAWIQEVATLGENWVKCSELLAAYGYGKPTQPIGNAAGEDGAPEDLVVRFVRPEIK
jgi:hypothetical protein